MNVGYFAMPGSQRSRDITKTHAVDDTVRPICGASIRPLLFYQRCGTLASHSVECKNCIRILDSE